MMQFPKISLWLLVFTFFPVLRSELYAQQAPPIQWQRCLGGTSDDLGYSIVQTTDGGFAIAGSAVSHDGDCTGNHATTNAPDIFVAKLDPSGKTIWKECLGGTISEEAYSIIQSSDGGFVIAGATNSNDGDVSGLHELPSFGGDAWIVKLDAGGKIEWQHCYGGSKLDVANSIIQTADGGYAFTGNTFSSDGDVTGYHGGVNGDIWMVKLDASGNIQWQKCLGGTDYDIAHSIIQTQDKGYVITGVTSSDDGDVSGNRGSTQVNNIWVVKLNSTGNILWQHCYGGSDGSEESKQIIQTSDGGYAIAGMTNSTDGDVTGYHGGSWDDWILRLDPGGNLLWQKCIGGSNNEEGMSIVQTADGGFTYTGCCNSIDGDPGSLLHHGTVDVWLVHLTGTGTIEWQELLGGSDIDFANQLIHTTDDGYALIGWTRSNDGDVSGNHKVTVNDIWVVKLGCTPTAASVYLKHSQVNPHAGDSVDIPLYINPESGFSEIPGIFSGTLDFSMNTDIITPVRFIPAIAGLSVSSLKLMKNQAILTIGDPSGFNVTGETMIGKLRCATYLADTLQTSVALTGGTLGSSQVSNCLTLSVTEDSVLVAIGYECGDSSLSHFMKNATLPKIQNIYPNPSTNIITVGYDLPENSPVEITIYNITGKRMKEIQRTEESGYHEATLDLSGLPDGIYFLGFSACGMVERQMVQVMR